VSTASTLTLPSTPSVEPLDLLAFPYPIVDERGYGPVKLALVEQGTMLASELDVVGLLGMALGRLAGYRTIDVVPPVPTLEALRTNGLLVGIYGNDPLITQLLGAPPPAETGVVQVVRAPHDPSLAILVVAGADEVGLRKAAEALVGQSRSPVLSGAAARVAEVQAAPVPPLTDEFLEFPRDRDTATLEELGLKDTTVRGYYAEAIRVPVDLGGDARARGAASMRVRYTHSALVDPKLSSVEVRLNGVVLRSRHLDGDGGEESLDVTLPAELIEPTNALEIAFMLFPKNFDPCRRVSDRPLWATLLATSGLTVPLDRYALLPDLSLLRHRFWPMDLEPTHAGAAILLGTAPTPDDASAALQLAAALGRTSPAAAPRLTIVSGGTPASVADADLFVLATPERTHPGWSALADAGRLTLTGDEARRLATGATLLAADVGTPYATVEMVHDGNRDVLALHASKAGTLLEATKALVDPARLSSLEGNAAVLPAEGGARSLDVASRTPVGKLSASSGIQNWVRSAWESMGVIVPVAALLAALIIGRWARGRGGTT